MEKKELVHSGILYDMSEGVIVISPDGTISLVNPAAEHILDRGAAELLGKAFARCFFEYPENDRFNQAILDAVYDPDARHVNVVPYYTGTSSTNSLISPKTAMMPVFSSPLRRKDVVSGRSGGYGADQGAQQPAGAAQPPAAYNLWQVSLR